MCILGCFNATCLKHHVENTLLDARNRTNDVFFECGANYLAENVLKGNKIKLDGKHRVYLPPMFDDSDFLPLLSFECALNNEGIQCCFNLDLVNVNKNIRYAVSYTHINC